VCLLLCDHPGAAGTPGQPASLAQEKEREANGVEMRSELGCRTQRGSPCRLTPGPGQGGMNCWGMGGQGEMQPSAGRGSRLTQPRVRQRLRPPAQTSMGLPARPGCVRQMYAGNVTRWKRTRCPMQQEGLGETQSRTRKIGEWLRGAGERLGWGRGSAAELGGPGSVSGVRPSQPHPAVLGRRSVRRSEAAVSERRGGLRG